MRQRGHPPQRAPQKIPDKSKRAPLRGAFYQQMRPFYPMSPANTPVVQADQAASRLVNHPSGIGASKVLKERGLRGGGGEMGEGCLGRGDQDGGVWARGQWAC